MNNTTVDLSKPSFYAEPNGYLHKLKRKFTYKNILKIIDKNINKSKPQTILEIGTGSGFLISILEQKYLNASIYGLEYDNRLVELTRSKLKKSIVKEGNAESFNFSKKFNIIVSLQVIEHLYNPDLMINCVLEHLEDGGVFIFSTPNLGCLSNILMKNKWHGYRIDHVSLKSRNEWDDLLAAKRFDKIYSGSTFFSGIPILNKLPLGIINWLLLYFIGTLPWSKGESYVGVFRKSDN